jgi:amyloid beta precursor protein binding protein 1
MKATSSGYHALSSLYRQKSQSDLAQFRQILAGLCESLGLGDWRTRPGLSDEDTASFVKHAAFLKLLRGRLLADERKSVAGKTPEQVKTELEQDPDGDESGWGDPSLGILALHVALLADDDFTASHGRRPGTDPADRDGKKDLPELEKLARSIVQNWGVGLDPAAELPIGLRKALHEV